MVPHLILPLCLSLASAEPMDAESQLKAILTDLARSPAEVERAREHRQRYQQAWQLAESLPEASRPAWKNTILAVLALPLLPDAEEGKRLKKDAGGESARLIPYYRALHAAAPVERPEAADQAIRGALAAALLKLVQDEVPENRGPIIEEIRALDRQVLDFAKRSQEPALTAGALHRLAFTYFLWDKNGGDALREELIALYEKLPEKFLPIAELDLDKRLATRLNAWSSKGYEDQGNDYLLLGLARYNEGLTDPAVWRESVFLYSECLRIGMVHRNVTNINNVGALLIQSGIGEVTGRVRKVRYLLQALATLPNAEANPHWRDRKDLTERDDAVRWIHARVHDTLGEMYTESGQTLLARHHLDQARQSAVGLADRAILPNILETQARLWQRIGQVEEALSCCRAALDGDPSLSQRAAVIGLMGQMYEREGDNDRALDCYRWALDLFVKPGSFTLTRSEVMAVGRIRAEFGRMKIEHGDFEAGLKALDEAASFAKLDSNELAARYRIESLRLARWLSSADRYRPSSILVKALERGKEDPVLDRVAMRGLALVGNRTESTSAAPRDGALLSRDQSRFLRRRLTDVSAAEQRSALTQLADDLARLEKAYYFPADVPHWLAAWRAQTQGDSPGAADCFQKELESLQLGAAREIAPYLMVEATAELDLLHHDAAALQIRQNRPAEALRILDSLRDRALLRLALSRKGLWDQMTPAQQAEAARLDDDRTRLSKRIMELARKYQSDRELGPALEQERRRLIDAEAAWSNFKAKISAAHEKPETPRRPFEPGQLDAMLADDEAILLFGVSDFETCAVLVHRVQGKTQITGRVYAIRRAELQALVSAFRTGCAQPGGSYELLGRELYTVLLAPFAEHLKSVRLLAVAADGPLTALPFAALPNERGTHLLERMAVVSVTSLALLHELKTAVRPKRDGCLIVDVQTFRDAFWVPASYRGQVDTNVLSALVPRVALPDLAGTRQEGDALAALFGSKADRFHDAAAQEGTVKKAAAGKRFVHFATHGMLDPYNPFQSALVLARPQPGAREDGFLEASEILEGRAITGAELVALSACETGLGMVQGSEGVLGISWALLAAGNQAVLASLWKVQDAPTAEWMRQFYTALLAGRTKAQALRDASLYLRKQPATAHPAYWAPFQLIGNWGK